MPDVYAVVDPMSSLVDFIAQRRRWINGSWYAFYDVVSKKDQINHCVTHIQLYYYLFIHFLSYIGIGIYFATIYLTVRSITK
jgi:cellulose synthase/poly-beta-1,6-N-acetylglucosamine synthase-like glycosyltransferase